MVITEACIKIESLLIYEKINLITYVEYVIYVKCKFLFVKQVKFWSFVLPQRNYPYCDCYYNNMCFLSVSTIVPCYQIL